MEVFLAGIRPLLDSLPFDVWACDEHGRYVMQNAWSLRRWGNQLGRTADEVQPLPEAVRAKWRERNARVLTGETVREIVEYDVDAPDGVYLAIITPVMRDGVVRGLFGANLDLTAERRAMRLSHELETTMRRLFETAPLAIGVREVRGDDLVHVVDNVYAAELFGRPAEQLVGVTDRELGVDEAVVRRAIERCEQARAAHAPVEFEMTFHTARGPRALVGKIAPIDSGLPNGTTRFAVVAEDVTESRAVQSELLRLERLASLGTLAASVGHEIKNPAMYVAMHLRFARDALEPAAHAGATPAVAAQALSDVRVALDGTERIFALVRELQTLGRPADDRAQRADLNAVVESVLTLAGGELRARAAVRKALARELPAVRGSGVRLGQVVLNLVMNAAQALDEDARPPEASSPEVALTTRGTADGRRVVLEVSDNGPGLPDEVRARLFEPFVSTRHAEHGTGLGLYTSRRIVESLGGTIAVDSPPGGGTTVRVELAAADAPAPPPDTQPPPATV